jgi:hypothetical protein
MRATAGILRLATWAAIALGACGGGDEMCSSVTACGGDVVGTWTITSDCTPPSERYLAGHCDTGYAVGPPSRGTFTFGPDLTFTSDITLSGVELDTWAPACFPTEQCAQLQGLLSRQANIISASCTRGVSCTCRIESDPVSATNAGTYTTTPEGLLTVTYKDGNLSSVGEYDYCAKGKTLTVSSRLTRQRFTFTRP